MEDKPAVGKWISFLSRYNQMYMARLLEPLSLGYGQHALVLAVCERPGLSQDMLAETLFLNKSSVARALFSLEGRGYLERRPDPANKRAYQVFPTEKAWQAVEQIKLAAHMCAQKLLHDFATEEKDLLYNMLRRMAHNAASTPLPPAAKTKKEDDSYATEA